GDVHRHHQIGGAAVALVHQALHHALFHEGHVHGDAGFLGEAVEDRLHQFGLAQRVDVHLFGQRRDGRGRGKEGEEGGTGIHWLTPLVGYWRPYGRGGGLRQYPTEEVSYLALRPSRSPSPRSRARPSRPGPSPRAAFRAVRAPTRSPRT